MILIKCRGERKRFLYKGNIELQLENNHDLGEVIAVSGIFCITGGVIWEVKVWDRFLVSEIEYIHGV